MALRLPPWPAAGDDAGRLTPAAVVATILLVHGLALWGLLQVQVLREAAAQAAPILVSLLAAPQPPAAPLPAPAAVQKVPRAPARPAPQPPVLALPPSAEATAHSVPPPQEAPAPPAAPAQPSVANRPAEAAAPAAPPPVPRQLPDDAVQYLQPPQPAYPPLSLRRRETGLVVVRAYIGTEGGAPRSVQLERGSGHARLDQAALAAVMAARFKPYAEQGQPVEGWALIPIRFDLEK